MKRFNHPAYLVIDNILEDPDDFLKITKELRFFSSKIKNPLNSNGEQWKGYRSEMLTKEQKQKYLNQIIKKTISVFFPESKIDISLNVEMRTSFHYMSKEFALGERESWNHVDGTDLFAGVIYLNKKPKKNSGTILYNGDEKIVVENKFNRMLLYRSDIEHSPDVGSAYGKGLSDSRLTLVFFINRIGINATKLK